MKVTTQRTSQDIEIEAERACKYYIGICQYIAFLYSHRELPRDVRLGQRDPEL